MKPYTRSIIELFDGKKRFLIPLYQRQYAWNVAPQLELLWEDIERIATRIDEDRMSVVPHFMGAMVIAQIKTFGKQVQAFEIIDGQQRLTTFSIFLASLRDVAAEGGSKYATELQKYLVNDGVMEHPEVERYKLWPSLTDRKAFIKIVDREAELDGIVPRQSDDGFVKKATLAHEYLKDVIRKLVFIEGSFDEHRFETIFEALKEGLAIVSIELEGGDDPQTIFETLNSRGVDLSPGDLMRNFIFQRAKGMGQVGGSLNVDKLYEKHWLPLDRPFWSQTASRGRQTRARLDWLLTDHLSMNVGNIISIENLYESYRRWILNERPFASVVPELEAITSSAHVEERLFEQDKNDALGDFGRFANAFDVSTAMPLVLYLATEANLGGRLKDALAILKSYILRRDTCGLTTKNYNKQFVGLIPKMREAIIDQVDFLRENLSERSSDIDRWPDDEEWKTAWMARDQYGTARQARLNYLFEMIEKKLRSERNEDIEIKSPLTIEHIMPQKWQENWVIPGYEDVEVDEADPDYRSKVFTRNRIVNTFGNLTLLTQKLNSSISNGPYKVKMPAIRAHSSLALNRDLNAWNNWGEDTIRQRGEMLFKAGQEIWQAPQRKDGFLKVSGGLSNGITETRKGFPADGTRCDFTYGETIYRGQIVSGAIILVGVAEQFGNFSAASKHVTKTSRNGWNDWYLDLPNGQRMLADHWRKLQDAQ
jgi:hypothetical protein